MVKKILMMVKTRRIQVENSIYHLYNRFVDGNSFFRNPEIVRKFREIFYTCAEYLRFLFGNVCRIIFTVIIVPDIVLSLFIQRYATQFARFINKEYNRRGHLFQGRHQTHIIVRMNIY